jgi:dGTPase
MPGSADAARLVDPLVLFGAPMKADSMELKRFLFSNLYRHPRVMQTANQAQDVVRELFAAYIQDPAQMPDSFASRKGRHRAVADYIAGMTDRFAIREHERLTGRPWIE